MIVDNPAAGEAPAQTVEFVRAEADRIMADRDGAYWDSNHVGHRETVERVSKLLTSAMGEIPAVDEQGQSADWNQQFEQALEPPENAGSYDFSEVTLAPDEELEEAVSAAEARVNDLKQGCERLALLHADGSKHALSDLERQRADLYLATVDRDTCRDALAKVFAEMLETGQQIDALARQSDVRNHYVGHGFSSRVVQALGPCLRPFGILKNTDTSHRRYGDALTVSEGTAQYALNLLGRSRRETARMDQRRLDTRARMRGENAA